MGTRKRDRLAAWLKVNVADRIKDRIKDRIPWRGAPFISMAGSEVRILEALVDFLLPTGRIHKGQIVPFLWGTGVIPNSGSTVPIWRLVEDGLVGPIYPLSLVWKVKPYRSKPAMSYTFKRVEEQPLPPSYRTPPERDIFDVPRKPSKPLSPKVDEIKLMEQLWYEEPPQEVLDSLDPAFKRVADEDPFKKVGEELVKELETKTELPSAPWGSDAEKEILGSLGNRGTQDLRSTKDLRSTQDLKEELTLSLQRVKSNLETLKRVASETPKPKRSHHKKKSVEPTKTEKAPKKKANE